MDEQRQFYMAMRDKAGELMEETFQNLAVQDEEYQRACFALQLARRKYEELPLNMVQKKVIDEMLHLQSNVQAHLALVAYLAGIEDSSKVLGDGERLTPEHIEKTPIFGYGKES